MRHRVAFYCISDSFDLHCTFEHTQWRLGINVRLVTFRVQPSNEDRLVHSKILSVPGCLKHVNYLVKVHLYISDKKANSRVRFFSRVKVNGSSTPKGCMSQVTLFYPRSLKSHNAVMVEINSSEQQKCDTVSHSEEKPFLLQHWID